MKHTKIYILISVICILGGITVKVYNYFAPPILRTPYRMTENKNTCDIAFIGDSWACLHLDHNCTIPTLLKDSFSYNSDVFSFGLSGKTSKEIYEAMYDNNDFIQFLQRRAYKYCVIAAGINDVNKKMSTRYYKESMNGIIQLLLYNDIHPIILEIPDFDVYKVYGWWRFDKKMLRRFSMEIYDIPIDCKQLFRDALDELIKEKGYQNKVSILRYKSWNNDYQNDLKTIYSSDGLHLNKYGYAVLDSIIANKIRYQEKETISMP